MNNRATIFIIGLLIALGLVGELLNFLGITHFDNITRIAEYMGKLGGVIMMMQHGTLANNKLFFRTILGFGVFIIIGSWAKILHLSFSNYLLMGGLAGIPILYTIHFLNKSKKNRLDLLKFTWVILFYLTASLTILHFPIGRKLLTFERIFFLLMFADFAYRYYWNEERKE